VNPQGVLQEPKRLLLTTTSVTDVLTMAAAEKQSFTVTTAIFANEDSTDRTVTLYYTENASDTTLYIGTCGAGQSLEIPLQVKMVAKSTARKIRAKASAGNVVTVTLIYIQSSQQTPDPNASQ
jgi:hypothetical protein